jgi:hypothetical protein
MNLSETKEWLKRYSNVLFFVGGFIFDVFTLNRIDNWLDLLWQSVYLGLITSLLLMEEREERGRWSPGPRVARAWEYSTEALHFCYGGLLSGYAIFYFKSTSASRSLVFLALVAALLFANEMPQVKAAGHRMRLGLYAFCLISYFNYLIPVIAGRMGWWTFVLALLISAAVVWKVIQRLAGWQEDPRRARWNLGMAPVLVLLTISLLYWAKWIPPVPLSLKYAGIYHHIQRDGEAYVLSYPKPSWYRFWQHDSNPFLARPGDSLECFVRVFAPRRFTHQIYLRWSYQNPGNLRYVISDRIPLDIHGGRGEGYRGVAAKSRYEPGRWRVEVLTEDDRLLGAVDFKVLPDPSTEERHWREKRM